MINPDHVREIRRRFEARPTSEAHMRQLMKDPVWRIGNLYKILTKPDDNGLRRRVKFDPNDAQCEVMYWQFVLNRRWLNILKARQLGFTTYFQIYGLDKALNEANSNIKFVSQTDDVAKSAFSEKAILAYNSLDLDYMQFLQDEYGTPKAEANQSQIEFKEGWGLYTYVKIRGGTSSFVHISELGPMAADNMNRAKEVFAGALETASVNADAVIESTFMGGQYGIYYDNLKKAMDRGEEDRPPGQFWFMFFPWYEDKDYRIHDPKRAITPSMEKYFLELSEITGVEFDHAQKLWYQTKEDRLGMLMKQENPSTAEEAMSAPVEGALYADILVDLQKEGRQCNLPIDRSRPVWAAWDIGKKDATSIWLVQFIDNWVHWLWHYESGGMEPSEFIEKINDTGIKVHKHLLPHDAYQERAGGSWYGILKKYGVKNCVRLPKTNDRWVGIRALQGILKRSKFNAQATRDGFDNLMGYRSEIDRSKGIMKAIPVHDHTSNSADAARYVAEGIIEGKIKDISTSDLKRNLMDGIIRKERSRLSKGFKSNNWWD